MEQGCSKHVSAGNRQIQQPTAQTHLRAPKHRKASPLTSCAVPASAWPFLTPSLPASQHAPFAAGHQNCSGVPSTCWKACLANISQVLFLLGFGEFGFHSPSILPPKTISIHIQKVSFEFFFLLNTSRSFLR